jgi:hypothetical protein
MGLDINWKEPELKRTVLESDKSIFKTFKEKEDFVCTRRVLFEKKVKTRLRKDIYGETHLIIENKNERRKRALLALSELVVTITANEYDLDYFAAPITSNTYKYKSVNDPITEDDLVSIYDMFS